MKLRQTGVALISVLLIVAILMAVATRLLAGHNLVINQHQNTFEFDQALHYALGAETLARQALYEDATNSGPEIDHLEELWAQDILPFELDEGGFLEAQLTDLNGCFNLNALSDGASETKQQAERVATLLGLPNDLLHAWRDWVDADDDITELAGAEEGTYLVANPAYRTPNRPVTSTSELYLMPNVDPQQVQALMPHVCLLPDASNQINVNTAGPVALASLLDPQTASLAVTEAIVAQPRQYATAQEFKDAHVEFQAVENGAIQLKSSYFALHVQAQVGEASVSLYSLLHRDPTDNRVTVLARDFGKLFQSNVQIETSLN